MIYDIINTKGEKLPDGMELKDVPGSLFLFIGGLFNLAGYENGDGLKKLVSNLGAGGQEKAQAFYIQEKTASPWEDKIYDGYLFEKEGKPSQAAIELAHAILLPSRIMHTLSDPSDAAAFDGAIKDLKNHFSRITLMGYSAGTALIRQMEACGVAELEKAGLTDGQIKSVVQCGVVVDVGPIYSVPQTGKTMTHFVTVHRKDMMTDKLGTYMGDFAFPEREDEAIVTAGEVGNSLILVPEIGSPTVRLVSQDNADPSGRRIHYDEVEEAHDLLMYLNTREDLVIGDKTVSTYPSLPTARLAKEFNAMAIKAAAKAERTGFPRNGPALLEDFLRVQMDPQRLQRLEKEFRREERYFEQDVVGGKAPGFRPSIWNAPAFVENLEKVSKSKIQPSV